jgi:hypothetical protein
MAVEGLSKELNGVLNRVIGGHDVIPFMGQMLFASDAEFRLLPTEMLEILRASRDYKSVRPGEPPTWFQPAHANDALELIVYRAEADGNHYVLAPRERN